MRSTLAGITHMAAPMNNIDGKKTDQLIELMKAELNKVKADTTPRPVLLGKISRLA
jgi:hypothetical protein